MKQLGSIAVVGLMVALSILYAWFRLGSVILPEDQSIAATVEETPKHLVTPQMTEASRGMVLKPAPDFRCRGSDGVEYALADLIRKGPVLLTFTKIGCPCSEAAQPFFNRLAASYRRVQVLGVIDGELGPAKLWASKIKASYPALLDPDLRLVRAYGVENSAYAVLIDGKGRIEAHWPGYSASMLQQLAKSLALMTGSPLTPIDTMDAPADLYTGCPYDL